MLCCLTRLADFLKVRNSKSDTISFRANAHVRCGEVWGQRRDCPVEVGAIRLLHHEFKLIEHHQDNRLSYEPTHNGWRLSDMLPQRKPTSQGTNRFVKVSKVDLFSRSRRKQAGECAGFLNFGEQDRIEPLVTDRKLPVAVFAATPLFKEIEQRVVRACKIGKDLVLLQGC